MTDLSTLGDITSQLPDLSVSMIKAFCGVCFIIQVVVQRPISKYWDTKYGYDPVRSVFTKNKFLYLLRRIHLCNNLEGGGNDRFFKVRKLLDIQKRFTNYVHMGSTVSVDESMIPLKKDIHC